MIIIIHNDNYVTLALKQHIHSVFYLTHSDVIKRLSLHYVVRQATQHIKHLLSFAHPPFLLQ